MPLKTKQNIPAKEVFDQCNRINLSPQMKIDIKYKQTNKQTNKQTSLELACTTDGSKLLIKSVCETAPKSCFWAPTRVFQDLSTCHDWPVNRAIINFPIRLKGNLKRISSNSLSPLAQNKDMGAASQTLLKGAR